ncbi:class I SAM-dependent methyltransferase [Nitrospira moscoviensis]|nr:class I SAM-dependent methyltransferase [Nitrospira moscoviensis]
MNVRRETAGACPLCGTAGETRYTELSDRLETYESGFGFQRCPRCSVLWLSPRPEREELPKFYPQGYYAYQTSDDGAAAGGMGRGLRDHLRRLILREVFGYAHLVRGGRWSSWVGRLLGAIPSLRRRAAFDWEELLPRFVPNGRLLDVGCGAATYLARMRELGWDVHGVDLSPDAARAAQNRYGIPVKVGMLPEARFPDGMFSVVTMSHVIEHVPDPPAHLAECRRIMAPGGRLIIKTPNLAGFASRLFGKHWVALDPPRHLVLFSPQALRECVQQAGFQVIRERSHPAMAEWNARISLFIRRQGHARGYARITRTGFAAWVCGLIERLLLLLWPWAGNELRLVAMKPRS